MKREGFKVGEIPIIYYKNMNLERAIDHLYVEADRAYREGVNIMILTDRGVDENHIAIPSLLAVSAMQKHLIRTKKRTSVALIIESAEPREVHDFAALIGYGACAVNPYLAQESIKELIDNGMLEKDYHAAVDDYNAAILHGIVKIASKMGISTIQSYQGSQIFEAIGIDAEVINKYFTNTVCRVGGITLQDIAKEVDALHSRAFDPLGLATDLTLDSPGQHKSRGGAEEHLYNPATIHMLQQSTQRGSYEMFKQYSSMIHDEENIRNIRGLLTFHFPKKGISIDEVESVDHIVTRFKTGAMSYGSISKEAHETPMLSLGKTKDREELKSWLGDKEGLLSWKLDGLTIVMTYQNGALLKAVTRGNGEVGEVITNNAKVFKNIPLRIKHQGELILRGEAVLRMMTLKRLTATSRMWTQSIKIHAIFVLVQSDS